MEKRKNRRFSKGRQRKQRFVRSFPFRTSKLRKQRRRKAESRVGFLRFLRFLPSVGWLLKPNPMLRAIFLPLYLLLLRNEPTDRRNDPHTQIFKDFTKASFRSRRESKRGKKDFPHKKRTNLRNGTKKKKSRVVFPILFGTNSTSFFFACDETKTRTKSV